MSIFADHEKFRLKAKCGFRHGSNYPFHDMKLNLLFQEALDLGSKGLLCRGHGSTFDGPVTIPRHFGFPNNVQVVGIGRDLYRLMELWRIDDAELRSIISQLYGNFEYSCGAAHIVPDSASSDGRKNCGKCSITNFDHSRSDAHACRNCGARFYVDV